MTRRTLLGVLTPSSNTALEPLTCRIVSGIDGVSAHFSRFTVTRISLEEQALGQFDDSKILAAAELLADAKVDAIGWSGTAAGWLGFDTDERLCERIHARTGIPATSSVLALNELMALRGVRRFGLVTPYTDDVQARIVENYRTSGIECAAERHLGISDNFEFSNVEPDRIARLIREVAESGVDAVATYCTNLRAAQLADAFEAQTGVPLFDTVSTVIWKMLRMAGIDPRPITGWGRLFQI